MGLFDRLFRTDPREALERAEGLLAKGEAVEALRLAERVKRSGSLAQGQRADTLIRRAKEALVEVALERADLAEQSGFLEDAAEWLEAALDHVVDEGRRAELEARAAAYLEQAEEEERRRGSAAVAGLFDGPETEDDDEAPRPPEAHGREIHLDDRYEAIVNTLDDDVAERYDDRPEAFRRAYVLLNEGHARDALPALEELAASYPEDPVYRLELGRCRLLTKDHEGARRELESVWETFGDEPLDHGRSLSVPGMWSEAMLALRQPEELLERLDEVAVPRDGDVVVCQNYATALIAAKRYDEALRYLPEAMNFFSDQEFPHMLAAVLAAQGRRQEAIDTLERSVAPSCSPAGCRTAPKHVPSLRALAGLHLAEGRRLDRVEELLAHIAQAQNGQPKAEDYSLMAELHRKRGDEEAAQEAEAEADRLRNAAPR